MPTELPPLLDRLRQSGLLEPAQLQELAALPEAADPDPKSLARVLLRRGWLSRFQINQIAAGRGKELTVGPYELLDPLGEGGMGQVFRARHRHMRRVVALKLIRKDRLANEAAVQRFYQEVQAAAQLHHPNIVIAYDAGKAENTHYLAMEYVEGTDLARLVRDSGPLPPPEACEYVRQAARGLEHAHERGLVHRDIKPANLLVSWDKAGSPVVKILDMGLARIGTPSPDKGLTQSGQVVGTPDYLAPEQAVDARTADIGSDLYSLGCTLYYLLTGGPPFTGTSLAQVLLKHQMTEPEPPPGGWEELPAGVRSVLLKLLAKNPDERYQTPQELVEALTPLCGGNGASPARREARWARRTADSLSGTAAGPESAETPRQQTARRTAGQTTEGLRSRDGSTTAALHGNRSLYLIAGGVGLVVVLLLVVLLTLILLPRRGETPTASVSPPAAAPPAPEAPPVPREPPRPVEPAAQVPAPPPVAVRAAEVNLSPLDRLDPGRIPAAERRALPAGLPAVALLPGHPGAILGVAFSPNGKRLAVTSRDGTLRLWDLTGAEAAKLFESADARGPVGSPTFSPDGASLAVATPNDAIRYDLSVTPPGRHVLPGCTLTAGSGSDSFPEQVLGFFPGGKILVAAHTEVPPNSKDGIPWSCLKLWDLSRGEPRLFASQPIQRGTAQLPGTIFALSVSPDYIVATGGAGRTLLRRQFDRLGNSPSTTEHPPLSDAIVGLEFSPLGGALAVTTKDGKRDVSYDTRRNGKVARLGQGPGATKAHDGWAAIAGFSPDGGTLMTRGEDRYVVWWNVRDGAKVREWQLPEGTDLWRFSPDARYAAVRVPGERIALVRVPATTEKP
jgi:serine/threonine protein kinase